MCFLGPTKTTKNQQNQILTPIGTDLTGQTSLCLQGKNKSFDQFRSLCYENVTNARRITMEIRKSNAFLVIATREFQNPCNAIALRENVSVVKVKLSIFHVPFFPKVQIFHSFQDFQINNSN